MKYFLIGALSLRLWAYADTIVDHLDTSCVHQPSGIQGIDATFLIRLKGNEDPQLLKEELKSHGVTAFEYNKFNKIPYPILSSYCSSNVSPYILTEILSQLSIYKYCLEHNIRSALILEDNAYIIKNPEQLSATITALEKKDQEWDLLYTDIDFHHPKTGEFVIPQLESIPHNKEKINKTVSKIHCRYGSAAFVISASGMKKIMQHFRMHWDNLPFDQVLFKIPSLHIYGTNTDIITNRYSNGKEELITLEDIKLHRPFYETGKSFWINPIELLTYDRFDAVAKYIYAKYRLEKYQTSWHEDLYKSHLENWIQFYNTEPLKVGCSAFTQSFNNLIDSVNENHFIATNPIPINNLGLACNGSHRIGTCLALDIPVKVSVEKGQQSPSMTAKVFREKYHLREDYLDHMAHEYAKLKKNTYIVSLFPQGYDFRDKAEEILAKYGVIVHHKDIWLSDNGCLEYIRLVYNGEWWTGSYVDDFKHSRAKANLCFPLQIRKKKPVRVYLYECSSELATRKVKEAIRVLCNYGNESIHINDTHDQTKIIAAGVFNKNSIQFMNTKNPNGYPHFDEQLEKLKVFIKNNRLDTDLICVDTGAVLGAYGLRDCQDLDIIHKKPLPKIDTAYCIESHNPHIHHHSKPLDELLFNPECHFYYQGIKFISLELVREMKLNRYSTKDLKDVELIDTLLNQPSNAVVLAPKN